ncbi:MAG: dihydroorotate dehydrogenase electron transfer subunit [Desulfuromonadaceae bacterium]|nr:dihydroorotate dehydrogenase electron transfer subunit [Desulfuromonadaceae bacterium]
MKDFNTTILSNQEISPGFFRMRVLAPGFEEGLLPGQFVMMRIQRNPAPFLRRPFCIFRTGSLPAECDGLAVREYLELLYKVVGQGTAIMATLHGGDRVDILGPLGHGFDVDFGAGEAILVAGGIGVAPLFMLGETLIRQRRVELLLGARCREEVLAVTEFERQGIETYVSTDDGSLGRKGLVTEVLEQRLKEGTPAAVMACGPLPMLKEIHRICNSYGVPLQVSLESLMGCGVGACLGCVIKGAGHSEQSPRQLTVCEDGPVFRDGDIDWSQWP